MAGTHAQQPSISPTATRPPLHSHGSTSVPSTPHQKARDYRFHSRSPSPRRGVNSHSPKSVASEALGRPPAKAGAPTLCKFETGDEIRKRRIPYVDGGHEELGPPKEEPKKTLTPDEREKLSGDMRELYDRLLPSQESEENRAKLVHKLERILNEEWPGQDIRVNVFGSSGNLLSSTDSDVDICITTPLKKLESMHSLALLLHKHGMEKIVCRAAAKVPIVKCWDPELQLAADLNVNNPLALQNTKMIKTYVQLDDRVRPLAKIIKYWTKQRILNDAAFGGTISSYTWICMIISFLQRRNPSLLPSLQKSEDCRLPSDSGETAPFADDVEALKAHGNENEESLGELLFQFFRHYGYEFEYSKSVVSVREGRLVSRQEKGWEPSNYHDKEAQKRLCVEEPFTINRNLGNSADDYAWHGIHGEIRRAFDLLADGLQLEKCCEQYEFPPEEKHVFQRPAPKPKPTLTRSASQSGQSDRQPNQGGRSRKNNRNQSAQRNGNRRASSGAVFSNSRVMLPPFASPTIGGTPSDYFGVKGNLHEQLYQQYQYLQLQQDALRSQLQAHHAQQAQVQHAQAQAQARNGDATGSPRHMPMTNGMPSPRPYDGPPQTAPLLSGYLYHYPAQYLPPSPMSQTRSLREGANTSPPSPSMAPAVPGLRRQMQRTSVPEVVPMSGRSQSQPGRSLPNAMNMQPYIQAGYDVSGGIPMPYRNARAPHMFVAGQQPGMPLAFSPPYGMMHQPVENPIPKEYVGYYVGQSPQLGPQQYTAEGTVQPPPLTLRDPPQPRTRRVTPDLVPPSLSERHASRSPSPLSHHASYVPTEDVQLSQAPTLVASPTDYVPPLIPLTAMPDLNISGPVIVNGSYRSMPKPALQTNSVLENGIPQQHAHLVNGYGRHTHEAENFIANIAEPTTKPSTPEGNNNPHTPRDQNRRASSPVSPTSGKRNGQAKPDTPHGSHGNQPSCPRLSLSPVSGGNGLMNGVTDAHAYGGTQGLPQMFSSSAAPMPAIPAPLLSPVAEMLTPSPTRTRPFDLSAAGATAAAGGANLAHDSPVRHGARARPERHLEEATSSTAELTKVMGDDVSSVQAPQKKTQVQVNGTSHEPAKTASKESNTDAPRPTKNDTSTTTAKPPAVRKHDINRWVIPPFKGGAKSASATAANNASSAPPRAGSLSQASLTSSRAVATPITPLDRQAAAGAASGRRTGSVADSDLQTSARTNVKKANSGNISPNTAVPSVLVTNGKTNAALPNGNASTKSSPNANTTAVPAPPQTNGVPASKPSGPHHEPTPSVNPPAAAQNQNTWQQATRKGHRKTKSSLAASPVSPADAANGPGGRPHHNHHHHHQSHAPGQSQGRLSAVANGERKGG